MISCQFGWGTSNSNFHQYLIVALGYSYSKVNEKFLLHIYSSLALIDTQTQIGIYDHLCRVTRT